jgi:hypothetical protein
MFSCEKQSSDATSAAAKHWLKYSIFCYSEYLGSVVLQQQ